MSKSLPSANPEGLKASFNALQSSEPFSQKKG